MSSTVHIIEDAQKDLYEIYVYIRRSGFRSNAQKEEGSSLRLTLKG